MTVQTIMTELEAKGDESVKKIFLKHGIKEPFFWREDRILKSDSEKSKEKPSIS